MHKELNRGSEKGSHSLTTVLFSDRTNSFLVYSGSKCLRPEHISCVYSTDHHLCNGGT